MSDLDDRVYGAGHLKVAVTMPLVLRPAPLPDPATIPPRPWLLGTQLLRGFLTVLVAPGGTGKSIYAMTAGLSLATGQNLLDLHVWERVNAAVINEDPDDELNRRLAAIMIRHKIDETEVEGRYFLNSMDDQQVVMASKGPDGFSVIHPSEAALLEQITTNKIGCLVVDPYAESHTLEENSNPDMIAAAAAWRRVARKTNCSIMLVHHVRKGASDGSIEAARGAKGLTDSARVGLVMQAMTEKEAESLGVAKEERWNHVRVDDAKVNLSPRMDKARWFKLDTVELHNSSEMYPNGDKIAAMVPWSPPKLFADVSIEQVNAVMDRIAAGYQPGILFSATRRGGSVRWAGVAVREHIDADDEQAVLMIAAWLKSGLLYETKFNHPTARREMSGLAVLDEKRPHHE